MPSMKKRVAAKCRAGEGAVRFDRLQHVRRLVGEHASLRDVVGEAREIHADLLPCGEPGRVIVRGGQVDPDQRQRLHAEHRRDAGEILLGVLEHVGDHAGVARAVDEAVVLGRGDGELLVHDRTAADAGAVQRDAGEGGEGERDEGTAEQPPPAHGACPSAPRARLGAAPQPVTEQQQSAGERDVHEYRARVDDEALPRVVVAEHAEHAQQSRRARRALVPHQQEHVERVDDEPGDPEPRQHDPVGEDHEREHAVAPQQGPPDLSDEAPAEGLGVAREQRRVDRVAQGGDDAQQHPAGGHLREVDAPARQRQRAQEVDRRLVVLAREQRVGRDHREQDQERPDQRVGARLADPLAPAREGLLVDALGEEAHGVADREHREPQPRDRRELAQLLGDERDHDAPSRRIAAFAPLASVSPPASPPVAPGRFAVARAAGGVSTAAGEASGAAARFARSASSRSG